MKTMTNNIILSKAKIDAIRKKANSNMLLILKKLNFRGHDTGDRITGCCPVSHSSSNTPNDNDKAFSWDYNREMWQCFSHRCHSIYGSDVFGLVRSVKKLSFKDAVMWVTAALGEDLDNIKELGKEEREAMDVLIRKRSQLIKHKEMEDSLMQHLKPSSYFTSRGFSDQAIREFGCWGEWHKPGTYGEGRAIVPIYDPIDGYLIAFTCRILDDSKIERWRPKWCHALNFAEMRKKAADKTDEEKFHASSVLFNLHRAQKHMGADGTIIVVEGPIDVMRLWEAGVKNVVAVLGTGFTKHHKSLLHKIGCSKLVTIMDSDDAGQNGAKSIERMCSSYFNYYNIILPGGKDPAEHSSQELKTYLKEYVRL